MSIGRNVAISECSYDGSPHQGSASSHREPRMCHTRVHAHSGIPCAVGFTLTPQDLSLRRYCCKFPGATLDSVPSASTPEMNLPLAEGPAVSRPPCTLSLTARAPDHRFYHTNDTYRSRGKVVLLSPLAFTLCCYIFIFMVHFSITSSH